MGLRFTGWLLVLGVLASACADELRPMPAVTWAGAQIERAGDASQLRFTPKRPPRIRIAGPVSAPTLALQRAAESIMIPLRMDTLDGMDVWIAEPPEVAAGPGELVLQANGYKAARQPIVWGAIATRKVGPEAVATLPLAERAGAWRENARQQSRSGDLAQAAARYQSAAEAADTAGQLSETARFRRAAVHQLLRLGRVDDARTQLALAEADSAAINDPLGRALAAGHRARLARLRGDLRKSVAHFEHAAHGAALAGERRLYDKFRILGAVELQYAGRHAEAIDRIAAIASEPTMRNARAQADLWANEAWIRLRAAAQGAVPLPAAGLVERLQSARDYQQAEGTAANAANLEDNLAMLHLLRGDLRSARRQLNVRMARRVPGNDPWFVDLLDARIAMAMDELNRAEVAFKRVITATDAPPEYRWRATFGLGRIARVRGNLTEARTRFELALDGLTAHARQTAIDTSRAAFFADHRALVEAAFSLAIEDGRTTDAFAIVDADRARITRALDLGRHLQRIDIDARERLLRDRSAFEESRRDGELQADQVAWKAARTQTAAALRQRFDRLVADASAPDTRPNLAMLAADERIVSAWRQGESRFVGVAGPQGVHWIENWPPPLPSHGHLYVVDSPDAEALTVAAPAGWTVSRVPYAGWLAQSDARAVNGSPVVLGDPDGTLPQAHAEAQDVAKVLGVTPLARTQATPRSVLTQLQGAPLFHFAGHGVLTADDPFDAHLRLAEGTRLGLADVLVARPRIGLAVLSGCETGKRGALAGEHAVGLAQAFLIAGADRVLAANAPVPDAAARDFMRAFHAANGAREPAKALSAVQSSTGPWRLWGRR